MAAVDKRIERAAKILRLLPAKKRTPILDVIEFLAQEGDLDLLLEVDDIEEDLALVKRVRSGNLSGTVMLEEARRGLRGHHVPDYTQ
jgi:hypothetical protein